MDDGDLHDGNLHEEISRLETRIEELAGIIESCRKFILASRAGIAIGGLLILAVLLGVVRFDPLLMIGAITAIIGGAVLWGTNTSTAQQAAVSMQAAEMQRTGLISRLDLRTVGERAISGSPHPL